MDALTFDTQRARCAIPYIAFRDIQDDTFSETSHDSDTILEDTSIDSPKEENVDYSIYPPDIGQSVTLNEFGLEVSSFENALRNSPDHNYSKQDDLITNGLGNEDSDQLALLAKLALSKHDNRPLPSSLRFETGSKFGAPNEDE
ncbi:unnamed protein product, partial [Protopolystoma xenopodis]